MERREVSDADGHGGEVAESPFSDTMPSGSRGIAMATVTGVAAFQDRKPDLLSGTPRAHAIDRWIFVFMAAWFIAIVLAGFIPDSLMKV